MNATAKSISKNIKKQRIKSGNSQEQTAKALSVSQQAEQAWESGKTIPQADRIYEIADHYGTSLLQIMLDDDELNPDDYILCDYTNLWIENIDRLKIYQAENETEQIILRLSIHIAEKELSQNEKMLYRLYVTNAEKDLYKSAQIKNPKFDMSLDTWRFIDRERYYAETTHMVFAAKRTAYMLRLAETDIFQELPIDNYLRR